MNEDYDKEYDRQFFSWGETIHSRELMNVNIIVDFGKKDKIVGLEIEGFGRALRDSQKEIDKLFALAKKGKKQ